MSKSTAPLDKLIIIEQWMAEIDDCYAQLDSFDHIPRRELFPRGRPITTSDPCAKSCPACALQVKFMHLKSRLGPIHTAALSEVAQDQYNYKELERERMRGISKLPRGKRGPTAENKLRLFGLQCVQQQYPDVTAKSLCEMLEVDKLTIDEDDIELFGTLDTIVIRDLSADATIASATIKKSSLGTYLFRARNT